MCHSHVNHTFVTVNVIGSVRNGRALCKTRKVAHLHLRRLAFLVPSASPPCQLNMEGAIVGSWCCASLVNPFLR